MQPNDDKQLSVPSRDTSVAAQIPGRDQAVALMRDQINRLYDDDTTSATATTPPAAQTSADTPQTVATAPVDDGSVYDRVYETDPPRTQSEATEEHWKYYHSAWQEYYRQYYERYYLAKEHAATAQGETPIGSQGIVASKALTKREATEEIRSELTSKIKTSAKRVRGSRHFIPIVSAIVVMCLFLFVQYNRLIFAQVKAYISPGSINPQNIILDPTTDTKVSQDPRIIIPKINVDAPVVYGLTSIDEGPVQNALRSGVIHYPITGASANPGEKGNAVFLGHSSNDVFDDGGYKFIFVQLEQLVPGDKFYLHYQGIRYTYTVTSTETILPTQVSKLATGDDKPTATLVTCTPVGTAQKRFLVHADQVSPSTKDAKATTAPGTPAEQPKNISGNSPTFLERIFGR